MRRRPASIQSVVGAACVVVGLSSPAIARGAEVSCRCRMVKARALATVEIEGLVNAEMERLIRLGLAGRLRLELEVSRKRWLWVEQRVAARVTEFQIRFNKEPGVFRIDGVGESDNLDRFTLPEVPLPLDDGQEPDARRDLTVRARLEVVTADSLARAGSWLVEGENKNQPSSWLLRGLLAAVTKDLQRSATTTCPVTPPASH